VNAPANGFDGHVADAELTTQPVTGLRAFTVDAAGRLTGLHYSTVFKPGLNTAYCRLCGTKEMRDCSCGFYAYFDGEDDGANYLRRDHQVGVGAVIRAQGRIVVGTKGFRAEKAELLGLFPLKRAEEGASLRRPRTRFLYPSYGVFRALGRLGSLEVFIGVLSIVGVIAAFIGVLSFTAEGFRDPSLFLGTAISAVLGPWFIGLARRTYHSNVNDGALERITWRSPADTQRGPVANYEKAPIHEVFGRLRVLYPDVPVYRSKRAALRAHKLSRAADYARPGPHALTPAEDPEFWDRPLNDDQREQRVYSSRMTDLLPKIRSMRGGITFYDEDEL
jgi:hypothetical protein